MARRSAALVLLAGTALAVSAAQALAREEAPPPQSGFAPALELIGIRDIQLQLKSHGYDAGPATGAMNEATYRAILAYERDYGLPQDGVAGPMVENALHFMPRRPMPQYAALTPPTVMPPAAPVPPVILPPAPQAAVPAPAATSDIAPAPAPEASPRTPVELAPVSGDAAPAVAPAPKDEAAAVPEAAAPAAISEAAAPAEAPQSAAASYDEFRRIRSTGARAAERGRARRSGEVRRGRCIRAEGAHAGGSGKL